MGWRSKVSYSWDFPIPRMPISHLWIIWKRMPRRSQDLLRRHLHFRCATLISNLYAFYGKFWSHCFSYNDILFLVGPQTEVTKVTRVEDKLLFSTWVAAVHYAKIIFSKIGNNLQIYGAETNWCIGEKRGPHIKREDGILILNTVYK